MKNCIYIIIFLIIGNLSFSQSDDRTWIRGKVLYKNNSVIAANVVNNTSQQATITDDEGEFEIKVKMNDRLVFSSVQYQIRSIVIDKEILQKSRIVIDVNEKVNQLREVVVGPENTEKFIDLKEEEFKKVDYTFDKSSRIENQILKSGYSESFTVSATREYRMRLYQTPTASLRNDQLRVYLLSLIHI